MKEWRDGKEERKEYESLSKASQIRGTQPKTAKIVTDFVDKLPGSGYYVTMDSYYGRLSTAKELLKKRKKAYFIMSCKADQPFKQMHKSMKDERGAMVWQSGERRKVLAQIVSHYRKTLNFVDRANSYRMRYYFKHRIFKHTRAQFVNLFFLTAANARILQDLYGTKSRFTTQNV